MLKRSGSTSISGNDNSSTFTYSMSKGIRTKDNPMQMSSAKDIVNFDVNIDGSLQLRNVLAKKVNVVYDVEGFPVFEKIIYSHTANDADNIHVYRNPEDNTLVFVSESKGILPITYIEDLSNLEKEIVKIQLKAEELSFANFTTSTIISGCSVTLQGHQPVDRFLKYYEKDGVLRLECVRPYTPVMDSNFTFNLYNDNPQSVKDDYNALTVAVTGILAYRLTRNINPDTLTVGAMTNLALVYEPSMTITTSATYGELVYLKAFFKMQRQARLRCYCAWEYTTDGIHWKTCPEFINKFNQPRYYSEEPSIPTDNYIVDLEVVDYAEGKVDVNTSSTRIAKVVPFECYSEEDLIEARPDIIAVTSDDTTRRFVIYNIPTLEEYESIQDTTNLTKPIVTDTPLQGKQISVNSETNEYTVTETDQYINSQTFTAVRKEDLIPHLKETSILKSAKHYTYTVKDSEVYTSLLIHDRTDDTYKLQPCTTGKTFSADSLVQFDITIPSGHTVVPRAIEILTAPDRMWYIPKEVKHEGDLITPSDTSAKATREATIKEYTNTYTLIDASKTSLALTLGKYTKENNYWESRSKMYFSIKELGIVSEDYKNLIYKNTSAPAFYISRNFSNSPEDVAGVDGKPIGDFNYAEITSGSPSLYSYWVPSMILRKTNAAKDCVRLNKDYVWSNLAQVKDVIFPDLYTPFDRANTLSGIAYVDRFYYPDNLISTKDIVHELNNTKCVISDTFEAQAVYSNLKVEGIYRIKLYKGDTYKGGISGDLVLQTTDTTKLELTLNTSLYNSITNNISGDIQLLIPVTGKLEHSENIKITLQEDNKDIECKCEIYLKCVRTSGTFEGDVYADVALPINGTEFNPTIDESRLPSTLLEYNTAILGQSQDPADKKEAIVFEYPLNIYNSNLEEYTNTSSTTKTLTFSVKKPIVEFHSEPLYLASDDDIDKHVLYLDKNRPNALVEAGLAEYTLQLVDIYEDETIKIKSPAIANSLTVYKKALIAYGNPDFYNNILVSDTGSTIFPITNIIDLDASEAEKITVVVQWRDYIFSATENKLFLSSKVENGYVTKVISNSIGIPVKDKDTVQTTLNGIIFKSGDAIYTLYPNPASSVDNILNTANISDNINEIIQNSKNAIKIFSYATPNNYNLVLAFKNESTIIKYDYNTKSWVRHWYPNVSFKQVFVKDISNILVADFNGIEYYIDKDIPDFPLIPYTDIVNVTLNEYLEFGNNIDKYTDEEIDAFIAKLNPIVFQLNSGEKGIDLASEKGFVECKFTFSTLSSYVKGFPMTVDIFVDGVKYNKTYDVTTDSPLWRSKHNSSLILNSSILIPDEYKLKDTVKNLTLRLSGKGKTIHHMITGTSECKFKYYNTYVKFRYSPGAR